jgi:hypothetical protein
VTVKELMDILNNKEEIPNPENAELCFYLTDKNGETIDIELKSMGAFSISSDITMEFKPYDDDVTIEED